MIFGIYVQQIQIIIIGQLMKINKNMVVVRRNQKNRIKVPKEKAPKD